MAYTPFQDGAQAFGIPDSPITVNSVTYIAEDIQVNKPTTPVEINDPNGIPIGQVLIPKLITGTAKLQFATSSTPPPPLGNTFTLQGAVFYVSEVGTAYTLGAYAYANISFRMKINA